MSSETVQTALKGKWALITGASSGLGADFARDLAGRGANLILVARRADKMNELAAEIKAKHPGIEIDVIPLDLAVPDSPDNLYAQVKAAGREVEVLINNAGFGLYGMFMETDWSRTEALLQLDIVALTHMTRVFAADMVTRRSGYILQVASIGAFQPSPTYAAYSAAKSYVLYFGEALNFELRP
ncbi:partial Fatty acyl-CoA reductase, partial [Anaerolineae bacterium]